MAAVTRGLLICVSLLALLAPPAAAAAPPLELDAGARTTLRIEREPFRVVLVDARGAETVATVPAREGAPLRAPGADGPQPVEPLGGVGGWPALGFVVGGRTGATIPVGFFSGNRLFGGEGGALVSLARVARSQRLRGGWRVEVETDSPDRARALLTARRLRGGGVRLELEPPPGLPVVSTMATLASPPGEGVYGLGARKDAFDQRGLLRNVWVEQQNAGSGPFEPIVERDPTGTTGATYTFPNGAQAAYFVQPFLVGSRGWAAWVGQTDLSRLDIAHSRDDAIRWGVASPRLTLTLAGGGIERASRAYTADAGRAPAPPRYVYEPWLDVINEGEGEAAPNGARFDGGPRVKADIDEIVERSAEHDVPIGVIGVEGWHKVLDSEGPQARAYFRGLRERGFRLAAYWNPFTAPGTPAHAEALRRGLFIRTPTGEPYPILTNRNNVSYVIDFTHPEAAAFWRRQISRSLRLGFEAFMHDFGEFPTEGMRFHDGSTVEEHHNAYSVHYHRAARAAIARRGRLRPWFYVRAGFSGVTGSTSGVFPGDETTDWARGSGIPSVVPAMLNLALGGAYTYTTDVGGYLDLYSPQSSPELFTRWTQLAAFTPVLRVHNSTGKGSRYPWDDEATLPIWRRYARAKVRLIPLVDRLSRRAARTGAIGPVRPLVLDDPSAEARSIGDQWLLGRDLLVAPVLREGARERRVYLPAGARWERVTVAEDGTLARTGELHEGGRTIVAPAPLADIPLFRRVP
jgi:sulfoquinovosidase